MVSAAPPGQMPPVDPLVIRHKWPVRVWHWLNAALLYILLTSGLGIFNAHPRLYWGQYGANFDRAWLEPGRFGPLFTLPAHYDLALSRQWHLTAAPLFAFALLGYMLWSLSSGHVGRDLAFRRGELRPRHVWQDIRDHARLRFPTGAAALRYNVLQKASYIGIIFIVLPVIILTGLTMSPGMNAAWPWLLDLFGGRQSARSIHFIAAFALVVFFLVHILMVVLAGPVNELRSMITGRYRVPQDRS